jgi:hypothetical protein
MTAGTGALTARGNGDPARALRGLLGSSFLTGASLGSSRGSAPFVTVDSTGVEAMRRGEDVGSARTVKAGSLGRR